jgi:hypothetical protein
MNPEDLAVWRRQQDAGQPNPWSESLRLLADGEQPAALDTGYLTAEDLANPDIAANVRAIEETAALIAWVAQDEDEGRAYGYWRGPADVALAATPVVRLDSEGRFELLAGANLSEVLCSEYGEWADEGYEGLAAQCREHGVAVAVDDPIDLPEPEASPTPAEHHAARYRALLAGS